MIISNNEIFNIKPYEVTEQGGRMYRGTVVKTEAVPMSGNDSYYKITIKWHCNYKNVSFKFESRRNA